MIPALSILPYDGTLASVPSNFNVLSSFADRTIKGATTGLLETGGSSTHSHTGTNSHSMSSHSHTSDSQTTTAINASNSATTGSNRSGRHSHSVNLSSATFSGSALSGNVTYAASSNIPPSYAVLFIQAQRVSLIPQNSLIFRQTSRNCLTFHTASAGRYLIGTTSDAGATSGSSTHTHDVSHTHLASSHSHSGTTGTYTGDINSGSGNTPGAHSHSFTVSQSLTGDTYTGTSPAYSNDPLYSTINIFKSNGICSIAVGDIILWSGSSLPRGYVDCDGTNGTPNLVGYYVKNNSSYTLTQTTGGSNTHLHTASNSHSHSQSHNHGGSAYVNRLTSGGSDSAGSNDEVDYTHDHLITGISTVTATWATSTITSDTVSNEPPYINIRFIMATAKALSGAGILLTLLDNGLQTAMPE